MKKSPRPLKRKSTTVSPIVAASILLAACESATGPGGAVRIEALSPVNVTGTVASEIAPAPSVRLTDRTGRPVVGGEILFWRTVENGSLVSTSTVTDVNGTATIGAWRLGPKAGVQILRAVAAPQIGSLWVLFTAVANPTAPALITALGDQQSVLPGSSFSLQVSVTDTFDNPIPAVLVTFEVESGGGLLNSSAAYTDSSGIARVGFNAGTGGQHSVKAWIPGLEPVRFTPAVLEDPLLYELQPLTPTSSPRLGWIALGRDNRFATSVDGITGSGEYVISGGAITLIYADEFLRELAAATDWWAYPYSFVQETGSITPDRIVLRRCYSEDCYESDWIFRMTEQTSSERP